MLVVEDAKLTFLSCALQHQVSTRVLSVLEKELFFLISFIIAEFFSRDSDLHFSLGHRGSCNFSLFSG